MTSDTTFFCSACKDYTCLPEFFLRSNKVLLTESLREAKAGTNYTGIIYTLLPY
jgi:hypothetical protein